MFEMDSVNVSLLLLKHATFARTIISSGYADRGLAWSIGGEVAFQSTPFLLPCRGEGRKRHFHFFRGVVVGFSASLGIDRLATQFPRGREDIPARFFVCTRGVWDQTIALPDRSNWREELQTRLAHTRWLGENGTARGE
jgi:hypothetical protein